MFAQGLKPIDSYADVGTFFGGIATAVGVLVALGAAYYARRQILAQREIVARQIYSEYLKLAIQYPELACGVQPADPKEFERYEWFVSFMLNACEHILFYVPEDPRWRDCMVSQIGYHAEYLSKKMDIRSHYSPDFSRLISRACEGAKK
jgi:hypothetical protein